MSWKLDDKENSALLSQRRYVALLNKTGCEN